MKEKDLKKLYSQYVEKRNFYRVVSMEYLPKIKKKGFTPAENPFDSKKRDIGRFFTIVENLEKKGNTLYTKWAFENVPGSRVAHVIKKDLRKNYIDLNPDLAHNAYYLKMGGGALVWNVGYLAKELLKRKKLLTKAQINLVEDILHFCKKKERFKMITLCVKATSASLEKAHFQHFGGKYWPSPFGEYAHFQKIIRREGWEKYRPYLEGKKLFYLRLLKRVPAKEIHKLSTLTV